MDVLSKGERLAVEHEAQQPSIAEERQEQTRAMAQELSALRNLTLKLHARAAHGDPKYLRTIAARREAVLDHIKEMLPGDDGDADLDESLSAAEKKLVRDAVAEIQALDTKTELILRERSGKIADELQKLRAGKRFRDSSRRWS